MRRIRPKTKIVAKPIHSATRLTDDPRFSTLLVTVGKVDDRVGLCTAGITCRGTPRTFGAELFRADAEVGCCQSLGRLRRGSHRCEGAAAGGAKSGTVEREEERASDSSPFGTLLRRHRLAAGLWQEALAERARMSTDGISALERGTRRWPQRETVALLADALGLSAEQRRAFEAAAARPKTQRDKLGASATSIPAMDVTAPVRSNPLPLRVKSFLGREMEVAEIVALMRTSRLVTITGTGGVGKTSTALEVGHLLQDETGTDVRLVELAPVRDASLVTATIARALDVREAPNQPLLETLRGYLKKKALLLVLDNCEHLAAEAAAIAAALLRACADLRVLATSREPLGVEGEYTYRLPSLGVPAGSAAHRLTAADAVKYGAVMLFCERARAVDQHFMLTDGNALTVSEICRRLDGIPLAIELAAARMTVLSVKAIHDKLDRRFVVLTGGARTALPRQQTMRALIDWSYDLLDARERTLLRRVSVFAGGWSLEACTDVCSDAEIDSEEIFSLLSSLVAKSLVMFDRGTEEPRYYLLESTLDYARERLASSGEADRLVRAYALYYDHYLREQLVTWEAMDDVAWQRAVLAELSNLRATLAWTLKNANDLKLGLEILSLIMVPALIFDLGEAQSLYGCGYERLEEIDDRRVAVSFRCRYAATMSRLRAPVAAHIGLCEETVAAARELDDADLLADSLRALGVAYRRAGRQDEADGIFAQAWAAVSPQSIAFASRIITDWANNDVDRGLVARAHSRFEQALEIARPRSQTHAIALSGLAEAEFAEGRFEAARILSNEAIEEFCGLGMTTQHGLECCNLAIYAMEHGSLDEARESLAEALQIFREMGLAYWLMLVLELHGVLAAVTNNDEIATALLGYTEYHGARLGRVRQTAERRGYDRAVSLLRERLGSEALARRLKQGEHMSEDLAFASAVALHNTAHQRAADVHGSA